MFHEANLALSKEGITTQDITNLRLSFATGDMLEAYGLPYHFMHSGIVWPVPDIAGIDTGDRIYQILYSKSTPMIKSPRYARPHVKTAPRLYFCPLTDWNTLNPGDDIFLAENPVIAVQEARKGRFSIGLCSITGWRARNGLLNPDFRLLSWRKRRLILSANSQIRIDILREMASQMKQCNIALHESIDAPRIDTHLEACLREMNEYLFQLTPTGYVLDAESPLLEIYHSYFFRNEYPAEKIFSASADLKRVRAVNLSVEWLRWPGKNQIEGLAFAPNEPKIINKNNGLYFNVWAHSETAREENEERFKVWTTGKIGARHAMKWRQMNLV